MQAENLSIVRQISAEIAQNLRYDISCTATNEPEYKNKSKNDIKTGGIKKNGLLFYDRT